MRRISSGSPFEAAMGYSRAVVKGPWCWVSGTTGYDYARMVMPDDAADQAQAAFTTIDAALREAGFVMGDVVRVRYVVTDAALVEEITPVLGTWLGEVRPAATMIVADLIRPEMKVEIDVTAWRA
ncbi:MAG: RidA family protein [Paracoccus sp. (in: a-proteobacteria)]|uniref:RidA family protein n=1 Tax=Paracoccus sp. TaxID=267 RepID=UPI0026DFF168|nr:RidA family protein [Paracoccus sp. (in: a-proteobacteria)]MDO5631897.1 RidA family protein [Paracoccus sp. (in: a-proteobacteria)]